MDYAYTIDGESLGANSNMKHLTLLASTVMLKGVSVHTGTAKDIMINCGKLAMQFDAMLPGAAVPEHTHNREGFFMLISMETQVDTGRMNYIIRDHDKQLFEAKKNILWTSWSHFEWNLRPWSCRSYRKRPIL